MEGGLGFHAGEDRANEDWMLAADATGMGVLDQSKEHFFFFQLKTSVETELPLGEPVGGTCPAAEDVGGGSEVTCPTRPSARFLQTVSSQG